jgi:hypothetical protein
MSLLFTNFHRVIQQRSIQTISRQLQPHFSVMDQHCSSLSAVSIQNVDSSICDGHVDNLNMLNTFCENESLNSQAGQHNQQSVMMKVPDLTSEHHLRSS